MAFDDQAQSMRRHFTCESISKFQRILSKQHKIKLNHVHKETIICPHTDIMTKFTVVV